VATNTSSSAPVVDPFSTLVLAMIDAPTGSLLVIDPKVGPTRVVAVKVDGSTWVDMESLHRVIRPAASLVERKVAFLDGLRLVLVDVTA